MSGQNVTFKTDLLVEYHDEDNEVVVCCVKCKKTSVVDCSVSSLPGGDEILKNAVAICLDKHAYCA